MRDKKEIWKPVVGFENEFEVSDMGNVRSLDRVLSHPKGKQIRKKRMLKQALDTRGYKQVWFCRDNKKTSKLVHRLVAEAFIENTKNKPEVNHKDGDSCNNKLDNLEWCTKKENMRHAWETGLIKGSAPMPVIATNYMGQDIEFESQRSASNFTGVNYKLINSCLKRYKVKETGGYKWRYK